MMWEERWNGQDWLVVTLESWDNAPLETEKKAETNPDTPTEIYDRPMEWKLKLYLTTQNGRWMNEWMESTVKVYLLGKPSHMNQSRAFAK